MNNLSLLYNRILNGIFLKYSLIEVLRLILLRRFVSYLRRNKFLKEVELVSIITTQVLILVISLDFRLDRRSNIIKSLDLNRLPYAFIDAVHGKKIPRSSLTSDLISRRSAKALSTGSIGCILSHRKALEYFLSGNDQYCIILEDDCIIDETFSKKITEFLKRIPADFDLIYLASGNKLTENLQFWVLNNLFIPIYPRYGQYAYMVSRKGAQNILETIFPVRILLGGIDTLIGREVSKSNLVAYHVYPNLCDVDLFIESNIYNPSRPNKAIQEIEFN